jgi:glycine dehydrogenase
MGWGSLFDTDEFAARHIGPDDAEIAAMLAEVGAASLDDFVGQIVPGPIQLPRALDVRPAAGEAQALDELRAIAGRNDVRRCFIGLGYHPTRTPAVIARNLFENPGWYTAYTPYQPEISQGRLEALLNFQQMVMDLTAMPLANASLLDEATAAAEAMAMLHRVRRGPSCDAFFVAEDVLPQTVDVIRTRARYYGFTLVVGPAAQAAEHAVFGALLQYPGRDGAVADLRPVIDALHSRDALAVVATDLLACALLVPPGELGADVVVGSSQRFGVPMGYGGPHAAFFACREEYKRSLPGRLIGVSRDRAGRPALRMALQTREQHIRREKATSNICTAQVLLANMASTYAVHHGPQGIARVAARVHRLVVALAQELQAAGLAVSSPAFFDTVTVAVPDPDAVLARADAARLNLRIDPDGRLGASLNETTELADVADLVEVFTGSRPASIPMPPDDAIPGPLRRTSAYLTHPVFHRHRSETALMRYLKSLQDKDIALDRSMIPLGSCTMKLNAAAQMAPVSWPQFADLHPFTPAEQAAGYAELLAGLAEQLAEITGYDAVSLQPNSGAQGEYAGLLAIRRYQEAVGQGHRDVCLIPQSAHGTNPASAQMMGLRVVVVGTSPDGDIDLADLAAKAQAAGDRLSCLMITYPSTHGVYEEGVQQACAIVHDLDGQVYLDGANLNAQVGVTRPGDIGADVSHLNLHKTFAIPHGGGGPGMGPIGVKAHLAPYLPGHVALGTSGAVSAAPYGSASILPISWMYVRMLGPDGLRRATEVALLNANYVATRLAGHYPVLYTGRSGRVAHECILDLRPLKAASGITEVDIAKRLMDYGFHAPTMSFPVAGTFMVEPTESESKAELDRFVAAMVAIRGEIARVESGEWPLDDNPLVRAPHTAADLAGDWDRAYTRAEAAFGLPYVAEHKFWPPVNRIDDVWGDRNLFCSCPDPSEYEE